MSIVSALFKLLRTIFKRVMSFVAKVFKAIWPLLLVVAVIYFAPTITAWLTSAGAPSWLTTAFSTLSTVTPYVTTAVNWLITGAGSLASSAGAAFSKLGLGAQLALVAGAAAALAPDEFTNLVSEAATLAGNLASTALGAVAGAVASSPIGVLAIGAGLMFFLGKDRNKGGGVAYEGSPV